MKSVKAPSFPQLLLGVAGATVLMLLLPLVAMQFTDQVAWTVGDFIAGAGLLFSGGTAIAVAGTRVKHPAHRVAIVAAIALILAVVWAELAVGLIIE